MSDEQREPNRDAGAPLGAPQPDQHPVPAYAGAPGPDGRAAPAADGAPPQYGGYGPPPGQSGPPPGQSSPPGPPPNHPNGPTAAYELPRQPKKRGTAPILVAALLAGVVGGAAGFGGAYAVLGTGSGGSTLTTAPSTSNASSAQPGSVAAAAQKAMPSAVDIRVVMPQGVAGGSGIVLTADGNVLTNNHVVAGGNDISITLADGSEHKATVVGTSPSYDLAVLKIEGVSGLTPATFGDSASLQVGQQVVAIGSPEGLTGTVTSGIISAFNRTVEAQGQDGSSVVYNGLQTDTPINHGNSGGALVNMDGQVIGINSAIATTGAQAGSIGLGFAIPGNQAQRVAQEILTSGTATKPMLGIKGSTGQGGSEGATVGTVEPGSAAATAGLVPGDVVTRVDDTPVDSFADLVARIGSYKPGDRVTLTIGEGGAARKVDVTLGSTPDRAASTSSGGQSENPFGGQGENPFGGLDPFGQGGN